MRITKPQAISLHNNALQMRKKTQEIELLIEKLFAENSETISVPESVCRCVKDNVQAIYEMLYEQQALAMYFLDGVSLKALKEDLGDERKSSALIDELEIPDSSIRLLKRHDIYTIQSLYSFLQTRSLTELKGCGIVKAEKIEEALVKYLEKI